MNFLDSKISAVIVLYYPNENITDNINSYIKNIDKVYVIDNSETKNEKIIKKLEDMYDNIEYISSRENFGVAKALNIACDKAINDGYEWILTMDQDSRFKDFNRFLECFHSLEKKEKISLISSNPFSNSELEQCQIKDKILSLTSGTLLNLAHFNIVGRFTEKLFIDEVDHDYCLRSLLNNLRVIELSNIPLEHHVGERILKCKKKKSQHVPMRVYYITRNNFYMASKYRKSFPELYSYRKVFYRVVYKKFFRVMKHEDDKLLKIKSICIGIKDFLRNQYGKKVEN